jgi:drug/metabolite transporter (DMT)-like permease
MSANLTGIAAMTAAMFAFNLGDTLIKVTGASMPVGEMLLIRGLFSSALIVSYAAWTGAFSQWRSIASWPVVLRTVADSACSVLFFLGLLQVSFADASAIGQFLPLMVMAGAALFLDEPVGWRRWSAAGVGLVGVLMIVKPGTTAFQPGALPIILSMVCVATRDLITRRMPASVPTVLLAVVAAVAVTVVGAVMAVFESWSPPRIGEVGALAVCGASVLAGYIFIIIASRTGDTALVAPFRYAYIAFAMVSSLFVFGEQPDPLSWLGIALIVGSGFYMLHRERIAAKRSGSPGGVRSAADEAADEAA